MFRIWPIYIHKKDDTMMMGSSIIETAGKIFN